MTDLDQPPAEPSARSPASAQVPGEPREPGGPSEPRLDLGAELDRLHTIYRLCTDLLEERILAEAGEAERDGATISIPDIERTVRALSTMAKTLDNIRALRAKMEQAAAEHSENDGPEERDALFETMERRVAREAAGHSANKHSQKHEPAGDPPDA